MSSWTWVAKTLKNLKLANPAIGPATQSRLMSAQAPPQSASVPPKPKKPLAPYFRYIGQVRETVRKENPDLKVTDLMKKIGQLWEKLGDKDKDNYMVAYKKDMESYSSILKKYKESLTPEQIELEQQQKLDKQLQREKREKKRRLKDLGKPKKPPSGFISFLKSKVPPGASIEVHQNTAKEWGPKWKLMSDAEKASFNKKYQEDFVKYEKELVKWEEKMLKQGNEDLVRISHLNKVQKGIEKK